MQPVRHGTYLGVQLRRPTQAGFGAPSTGRLCRQQAHMDQLWSTGQKSQPADHLDDDDRPVSPGQLWQRGHKALALQADIGQRTQ